MIKQKCKKGKKCKGKNNFFNPNYTSTQPNAPKTKISRRQKRKLGLLQTVPFYQTNLIKQTEEKKIEAKKELFNITPEGGEERARIKANYNNPANEQLVNELDSLRNLKANLPAKDLFGPREQELSDQIKAVHNKIKNQ